MSWLDKMSKAIHEPQKCDHCNYYPENIRDYEKHLDREHPEGR